jgi:Pyruvate/2-oxoacid:ferredoxin oxidoreductase gamma subunit/NAD-dependent dihydropyrimidine dehydrogenase PreA subunit
MQHVDLVRALQEAQHRSRARLHREQTAREVQRCLNCDVETVFTAAKAASSATPASTSVPVSASPSRRRRPRRICASACRRRRQSDQALYASKPAAADRRVMVKDEDLCVHCGLCAERCPTAAWDMQKFDLLIPTPGRGGRSSCRHRIMPQRINDFAVKLANVNGTGSASANSLLMQAIFRMGVPVSGKNLFPSNIQGLPTWYEIRVNKDGYTARALDYDLMVAMNAQTYARDVRRSARRLLLYDSTWPLDPELLATTSRSSACRWRRCATRIREPRERILMKNIAYAGVLAALLDIDMEIVEQLLEEKYGAQEALLDRTPALQLGYDYAQEALRLPAAVPSREDGRQRRQDPDRRQHRRRARLRVRRRDGRRLVSDHAVDLVMDAFKVFCERYRKDPKTGEQQLHDPAGRGRAGGDRHGDRRVVERRARVHLDRRSGHLADERIARPRLLRRDSRP